MVIVTIAQFELRSRLKLLSTYVYFLMFFALALLWMAAAGGLIPGAQVSFGGGKQLINAPYAVAQAVGFLGYLGLMVVGAMMGRSVQQDFEYRCHHFFFSMPISKTQYLLGRFLGAYTTLLLIFLSVGLGIWLGTLLPGQDADRLAPNSLSAYVLPYLFTVLPNFLLLGAIFFGLAALTRRMMPVYLASVVLLVGYLIAKNLMGNMENQTLAALLDPFGSMALSVVTRYWTLSEKNTLPVMLEGVYLWNRLLWMAVAVAIAAYCWRRFQFVSTEDKKTKPAAAETTSDIKPRLALSVPASFSAHYALRLLPRLTGMAIRETVKNTYFAVIVLAGVLFVLFSARAVGMMFGKPTYPVTYAVLEVTGSVFSLFILIITTFYAGELIWRERDARMHQIYDALPIPTWLPLLSKLTALITIQALLLGVVMCCGLLIQAGNGYYQFELPLYLKSLFGIALINYALVAVLALAVQVIVNNKYVGHFLMVMYYVVISFAPTLGFEHKLYLYGSVPTVTYSAMNEFGHFMAGVRWFEAYWALAALLLVIAAQLLWVRGTVSAWAERIAMAKARFTPGMQGLTAVSMLAFLAVGGYVFYNTTILNRYETSLDIELAKARYEKTYKVFADTPQPVVRDAKLNVELYPEAQRGRIVGRYLMRNNSQVAIDELLITVQSRATVHKLQPGIAHSVIAQDAELGVHRLKLTQALVPGAELTFDFDIEYHARGFKNSIDDSDSAIVANGTFFNSGLMPQFGYGDELELSEDRVRAKHGLSPKERMADLDDAKARMRSVFGEGRIHFDATIGTSADQIAVAPGYLQKQWQENGRRYFHYTMAEPIVNFYSIQSARYAVKKDRWQDVAIEIYYHPGHEYNLERMIEGVKDSLSYYTTNFGPYQHKQVRILEFPRYQQFAQAFAGTIPYSESMGFIAKVDAKDEKDLDYPYYVTAHEVAHQWWGHQVVAGEVQGMTFLVESLSQYSALMVMKQKYGRDKMTRFLSYELDRYLEQRGDERKKELPLMRVEDQAYLHYRKGSVVMYALQDYLGEEVVNQVLKAYVAKVAFQEAPFTNARELVDAFRAVTPPAMQYLLKDWFETITLYENRALSATSRKRADGRYEVTLKIAARKFRADEQGVELEVTMNDLIEIGVLDKDDKPLLLEKRTLKAGESELTLVVDKEPAKAGIDPYNKLIDRRSGDNRITVTQE